MQSPISIRALLVKSVRLDYLGKHSVRGLAVALFLDAKNSVVVSVQSGEKESVVQAIKKLRLKPTERTNLAELQGVLAAHSASLEFQSSAPTKEGVETTLPQDNQSEPWLRHALEKVEKELKREEREYAEWKGVRDLAEATENWRKRRQEIFELGQQIVEESASPFSIVPTRGSWERVTNTNPDLVLARELRDQAKERASALRQRIDWSRRTRIKRLKDQKKDLLKDLEEEAKREKSRAKEIERISEETTGIGLMVTVRSQSLRVKGRRGKAIHHAANIAMQEATLVKTNLERLGFTVSEPVLDEVLAPAFLPRPSSFALVPRDCLERQIAKLVGSTEGASRGMLPDLTRFPKPDDAGKRKLAYLGLAVSSTLERTRAPILIDVDMLTRHAAVIGASGGGKSFVASLLAETALDHGIPVLVYDPTRSWTGFALACSAKSQLDRYGEFGLRKEWARGYALSILEPRPGEGIHEAIPKQGMKVVLPTLLTESQETEFVERLLRQVLQEIQSWPETSQLRCLLVIEEAHRLRNKAVREVLELLARQARVRGLGLILVSQVLTDLGPAIRGNVNLHIFTRTSYAQDLTRVKQLTSKEIAEILPQLRQGHALVTSPEHGSAFFAARPPLHAQAALPDYVGALYRASRELRRITLDLVGRFATDGATTALGSPPRAAPGVPEKAPSTPDMAATSATWRDVATRMRSSGASASKIAEAIREARLTSPSLRTIQRFMAHSLPEPSPK